MNAFDEKPNPENLWDPRNSVPLLETTVLLDSKTGVLERFPSASRETIEARKNHDIDEVVEAFGARRDIYSELRDEVTAVVRSMETRWRVPPAGRPLAYTSRGGNEAMSQSMKPGKVMAKQGLPKVEVYDDRGVRRLVDGDSDVVKEACRNHARASLAERIQNSPWWTELAPREREILQVLTHISAPRLVDPANVIDPEFPYPYVIDTTGTPQRSLPADIPAQKVAPKMINLAHIQPVKETPGGPLSGLEGSAGE